MNKTTTNKITKDQFSARMVMEPRKPQSQPANKLPADFIKDVTSLFNTQFEKQRGEASFSVHGAFYPDEVLLCVTLMKAGVLRAASFYASMDLPSLPNITEKPQLLTENLQFIVDLVASWYHQCFDESGQNGIEAVHDAVDELGDVWEAVDWEKKKIYVLVNKDNHTLETAADRILREGEH